MTPDDVPRIFLALLLAPSIALIVSAIARDIIATYRHDRDTEGIDAW